MTTPVGLLLIIIRDLYNIKDNKGLCIILGRALEPLLSLNYFLVVLELDRERISEFSEFSDDINGLG